MFEDGPADTIGDALAETESGAPDFAARLALLERCFYSFAAFGEGPLSDERSSA